ncbi:MAG TPA: exodeoxyribonuclease VII large subunit [Myxococcales bacterium]|jgi:exodeoxyribonuclease VII large subunit|nr:exodeoxyribonuclease VII large subunit [Myxococcales bacterium]
MPERLPPKPAPATSAGQFDLFGRPRAAPEPEAPRPLAPAVPARTVPAVAPVARPDRTRVYSVRELTREIKGVLGGRFIDLRVRGEVSNLKISGAGHAYFTLKDEDACITAVLFRNEARRLKFKLQNGQSLVARGSLDVYEAKGEYQLVCDVVEPVGAGALQIAFEQLKSRLQAEGLFAEGRKRKLPFLPRRIAIVTSPSGAAVHDFLRVLHRRFPNLPVLIVPARVQGEGAAQEIARGIVRAGKQPRVDLVVVARGGGSLEDLWAFNEEVVARALCGCPVPTVSAVGHEVDVTIADFCADVRAPTPTAAAELIAREKHELQADLAQRKSRLQRAIRTQLERRQAQLDKSRARIADPRRLVSERRLRLDKLLQRAEDAARAQISSRSARLQRQRERLAQQHPREKLHRLRGEVSRLEDQLRARIHKLLAQRRQTFVRAAGQLDALSPLKVLSRGYAVAFDQRGQAVKSAAQVRPGERLRIRLHEGELDAQVLASLEHDTQTE